MASRWRVWSGEAHVDSHGVPPKNEFSEALPVPHTFDWCDVPKMIKRVTIPNKLQERICNEEREHQQQHQPDPSSSTDDSSKYGMKGVKKCEAPPTSSVRGRAEALRMRLKARAPKHQPEVQNSIPSVKVGDDGEFVPDNQTLYFKHLPKNVTEKELEGSISQFGKVSVCKIYHEVDESIAYIRLEEASACDWVISYYRGMPYDDGHPPLECDYVIPQLELMI